MKRIIAAISLICVCFAAVPAGATGAMIATEAAGVSDAQIGLVTGERAYASIRVVRVADGSATFWARVCIDVDLECDDYSDSLTAEEFILYPGWYSTVIADIPELGAVNIRFTGTGVLARSDLSHGPITRTATFYSAASEN